MPNFLNYTYFGAEGVCEISAVPYLDVFDISLESLFLSFSQQMMQNGVGLEVGTFPSFSSLNLPSVPSFQSPLVIGLVVSTWTRLSCGLIVYLRGWLFTCESWWAMPSPAQLCLDSNFFWSKMLRPTFGQMYGVLNGDKIKNQLHNSCVNCEINLLSLIASWFDNVVLQ